LSCCFDFFPKTAWLNTPFNPLASAGPSNPLIPVKNIHLGKGWGYGVNAKVTPYTGELVPFADPSVIASAFTTGKTSALKDFNTTRLAVDPSIVRRWCNVTMAST